VVENLAETPDRAAAQYRAVRAGVGLVDRTDLGLIEVTGRDRAAFLHAMLSNDIQSLPPGQGRAAAFLDVHGKVRALLYVWALEDRLLLVTPPGLAAKTVEGLDHYLFSEKAVLRDATGELSLLMLAGPGAPALAERLTGTAPPAAPWASARGRYQGEPVQLVRGGGETGEAEVWLAAPAALGDRLRRAATEAGAVVVGHQAWESLRIEAGWPAWGRDVDQSVLLPEIPIERWVSYTKGCYIGQEVVVRIRDRGHVNRHLRGLLIEGEAVPAPGSPVLAGDAEVGRVTSAAWSFGLARPVALAFVRRAHAAPGTRLEVRAGERTVPAVVSDLPLGR
jgi:folate-binding protein YgfZ